jgi:hypothetical protein
MKKHFFLLFILINTASCSTLKISSDYDKTADFASYKTYGFIVYRENLPYDPTMSERVLISIANELEARGMKKSDNPDVFIDVKARKGQSKTVASYIGDTPDYYGSGYIYTWGYGFSTSSINFSSYAEGTMFIDMIDARKKQLVWQGRGVAKMDLDRNSQEREKRIADAVAKIFSSYPPKI